MNSRGRNETSALVGRDSMAAAVVVSRGAGGPGNLDDELRDHLDRKTQECFAQGMTEEEAHRRARLDLVVSSRRKRNAATPAASFGFRTSPKTFATASACSASRPASPQSLS